MIDKTPSVYFRFEDESQRNLSKSSLAFDYSVSNQKMVIQPKRDSNNISTSNNKRAFEEGFKLHRLSPSPLRNRSSLHEVIHQFPQRRSIRELGSIRDYVENFDLVMIKDVQESQINKEPSKLKTEEFFDEFQQNFVITFEEDDDVFVSEWNDLEPTSKVSKGNLNFGEEDEVEEAMKRISIESNKRPSIAQIHSEVLNMREANKNLVQEFEDDPIESCPSSESSYRDKENRCQNNQLSEFEQIISFGPTRNNEAVQKPSPIINSKLLLTKDLESNNSHLLEKNQPLLFETKKRVPFKNIENIVKQRKQPGNVDQPTRKKQILNGELLVSTINKNSRSNVFMSHPWSNPLNSKKSESLESKFNHNNMFKTNAFRETLRSTTLENWKKKHHQKQQEGDKKTVSKKRKNVNIFDKLFIRG